MLAWLFARSQAARFLLRVEDLDPQRSKRVHEEGQLADLNALGLDWDGEPVRQSERTELYRSALGRLEDAGRVYPCWCTRAEIRAAAEAPHGPLPEGSYPGTCRELTRAGRAEREHAAGRSPALRLDAGGELVRFHDRLHGEVERVVDDLVLRRGDGTPAYNLAVVVDDAEQGIGEVVRGDDLLETTAGQLLLARLLGVRPPSHAHVPLVLGPDGARLSKRHGAVALAPRDHGGPDAAAALSWMGASLGLSEPGEMVTPAELLPRFDPERLPNDPSVWGRAGRLTSAGVIDPEARVGHIHLKVSDLDRAIEFYRDVLGWELQQRLGEEAAFLSAGGYHHHIGLNTWESRGGPPPPRGTTGLFHVAFLYPDRPALARAVQRVIDAGVPLTGASDHGVSEAIYLQDPDGNGIELYFDRPREEWPRKPGGELAIYTAPLDLGDLLAQAA